MQMRERMVRFMTLTFALLGWAFYELSGGAEFAPPEPIPTPRLVHAEPAHPAEDALRLLGGAQASEAPAEIVPASFGGPRVVAGPSDFQPVSAAPSAPEPTVAEPVVAESAGPPADRRAVTGSRVNLRAGPGPNHAVLDVLSRGETAEVLEIEGGWARIRAGEQDGWMALSMLSEPQPG